LHDVHPATVAPLSDLIAVLPEPARAAAAVLVVPDHRHVSPVDRSPEFCDWVRRTGRDVVLHGHAHEAADTVWNRFWYGSANDAEFARLDRGPARHALAAGIEVVTRAIDRAPRWFCAPRWSYSAGTFAAMRDVGLAGWMLRDALERADGVRVAMPAVWFDDGPRSWRRRGAGLLRRRRVARLMRGNVSFRLALHPRDVTVPDIRREIADLVSTLTADGWTPVSLSEVAASLGGDPTNRSRRSGDHGKGTM
jgi:predicted deacetylase